MSDGSGQKDPSLDEILGSIRRIINEDSAPGGRPETRTAKREAEEDILDLTDEVLEESADEGRREPIFGTSSAVASEEGAEQAESPRREPVLGVGLEAAQEPLSAEDAGRDDEEEIPTDSPPEETRADIEPEPRPRADDTLVSHDDAGRPHATEMSTAGLGPEASAGADQAPQEEQAMTMSDEPGEPDEPGPTKVKSAAEKLVSEAASSATTAALSELNRAMIEKGSKMKVGEGDATISEMVRELLRPMLREWIDENLPVIVERVVKREIQKLVDRTEDDD